MKLLVVIAGPTAVGKTALAVALAQHFRTDIVSCDSRQFFKELKIGVARPSQEELKAASHHFIGHLSIHENYTAGTFAQEAMAKLEQLFTQHEVVICAGGSGLYLNALLNGLDDLPADETVRTALMQTLQSEGLDTLLEELQQKDRAYWDAVDRKNPHRVVRALEVMRITGKPYSQQRTAAQRALPFEVITLGLNGERSWLHHRIEQRVDQMMQAGLEQEARQVWPLKHLNALNTVGYKELFAYFEGKWSRAEAVERIKIHTRQYARRQLTWWRRDASVIWLDAEKENVLAASLEHISKKLK